MNIEDDFMWVAGNAFSEMRLLVEGAVMLFEEDAGVLCRSWHGFADCHGRRYTST